ncbi:hypothetical protein A3Q56_04724 [Intoshia linei]|uniref:Anti-proliferative protein domain-containing protein n=1 Tax=Intoshia linei TaxID=1819745 RepID=A0A177B078_9BILA|nr:hypothetical protein A3Q56_04724 [Intoshia linei]
MSNTNVSISSIKYSPENDIDYDKSVESSSSDTSSSPIQLNSFNQIPTPLSSHVPIPLNHENNLNFSKPSCSTPFGEYSSDDAKKCDKIIDQINQNDYKPDINTNVFLTDEFNWSGLIGYELSFFRFKEGAFELEAVGNFFLKYIFSRKKLIPTVRIYQKLRIFVQSVVYLTYKKILKYWNRDFPKRGCGSRSIHWERGYYDNRLIHAAQIANLPFKYILNFIPATGTIHIDPDYVQIIDPKNDAKTIYDGFKMHNFEVSAPTNFRDIKCCHFDDNIIDVPLEVDESNSCKQLLVDTKCPSREEYSYYKDCITFRMRFVIWRTKVKLLWMKYKYKTDYTLSQLSQGINHLKVDNKQEIEHLSNYHQLIMSQNELQGCFLNEIIQNYEKVVQIKNQTIDPIVNIGSTNLNQRNVPTVDNSIINQADHKMFFNAMSVPENNYDYHINDEMANQCLNERYYMEGNQCIPNPVHINSKLDNEAPSNGQAVYDGAVNNSLHFYQYPPNDHYYIPSQSYYQYCDPQMQPVKGRCIKYSEAIKIQPNEQKVSITRSCAQSDTEDESPANKSVIVVS